jgi:hypothetical protein
MLEPVDCARDSATGTTLPARPSSTPVPVPYISRSHTGTLCRYRLGTGTVPSDSEATMLIGIAEFVGAAALTDCVPVLVRRYYSMAVPYSQATTNEYLHLVVVSTIHPLIHPFVPASSKCLGR